MNKLNQELIDIFREHSEEIGYIGSQFGELEKQTIISFHMDIQHMFEGYLYHVAKVIALWGCSAQEKILYEECGSDHTEAANNDWNGRIEALRMELYKFAHKLNDPDTEFSKGKAMIITDGKWSHQNYDVSKCFRADYELPFGAYCG